MRSGVHRYWLGDRLAKEDTSMSVCKHGSCSQHMYLFKWGHPASSFTYVMCSKHSMTFIENGWKAIKAPKCRNAGCSEPSRVIWHRNNGMNRATRCKDCGPSTTSLGPPWNKLTFEYMDAQPVKFEPTRRPRPLPS